MFFFLVSGMIVLNVYIAIKNVQLTEKVQYYSTQTEQLKKKKTMDEGYRSFSADVVYFLNPDIATSKWIIKNRTFVTSIGNHDFYK